MRTAKCETGENNQDDWSEAQDNGDQAQNNGDQNDGDTSPDDRDGLADSEDSGINSEVWIESILNPSAEVFIPHNSSRGQDDEMRDQDEINSPDTIM